MAKLVRCDRCGKTVEPNDARMLNVAMDGRHVAYIDLCKDCTTKLNIPESMQDVSTRDKRDIFMDALYDIFAELHADMEHE